MVGGFPVPSTGTYACCRCGTLLGLQTSECPQCIQNILLEEANLLRRRELEVQQRTSPREVPYYTASQPLSTEQTVSRMQAYIDKKCPNGTDSEKLDTISAILDKRNSAVSSTSSGGSKFFYIITACVCGYLFHILPWSALYSLPLFTIAVCSVLFSFSD
jgi:predicted ATP-dependent serine protease